VPASRLDIAIIETGTSGVFTLLPPPPGPCCDSPLVPNGINDAGQIVGWYSTTSGNRGFLDANGIVATVNAPGSTATMANGINYAGQIVGFYHLPTGYHGFLDINGVFTTIDFPGATDTFLSGINASGEIVGYFDAPFVSHSFLYDQGVFTTFDFPGAVQTFASAINDAGEIVGNYFPCNCFGHAFLYRNGSFTNVDPLGAIDAGAGGINNSGEIVGTYTPPPIPEPASLLFVACGLVALVILSKLKGLCQPHLMEPTSRADSRTVESNLGEQRARRTPPTASEWSRTFPRTLRPLGASPAGNR
jgi:probable HAF family extracellular repeat protein